MNNDNNVLINFPILLNLKKTIVPTDANHCVMHLHLQLLRIIKNTPSDTVHILEREINEHFKNLRSKHFWIESMFCLPNIRELMSVGQMLVLKRPRVEFFFPAFLVQTKCISMLY